MTKSELLQTAKPILFNTDMVRAILEGRKTVTRRICKDGNDYVVPDMSFYDADKRTYAVHNYANKDHTEKLSLAERPCPICPGDVLYVRETWNTNPLHDYGNEPNRYVYKADYDGHGGEFGWHPSIHMPKEAARIWLKVTDVRVERLQDITDEQILKEGINQATVDHYRAQFPEAKEEWIWIHAAHWLPFSDLWNSTIKKQDLDLYGWDANPWVWVIEFEKIYLDG